MSVASLLKLSQQRSIVFAIICWFLGLFTILLANQHFFPQSKFADLTSIIFFNQILTKYFLIVLLTICTSAFSLALISSWRESGIILGVIAIFYFIPAKLPANNLAATTSKPNIILVGIDSLRPDFLGFFGANQQTPFLDNLLKHSIVFDEATTPLARTFPSWVGILTGEYPTQSGVRFNLANQDNIDFSQSLPNILRQHGYETIFATDETRFSNIDKNAGFDRIIAPPIGLNDFLLGTFNDFPLSNLVVNTALGRWLFPYSYANRPVFFTYQPDSFLSLLKPTLQETRTKPLFLATHFCLPHHPYVWASSATKKMTPQGYYAESIQQVDKQIRDFFKLLSKSHLLDHAVVVILSDHGEALALDGDRITEFAAYLPSNKKPPKFYPESEYTEAMNQTEGHGTEVLGLPQYHSLLAFRFYGVGEWRPKQTTGVVTLLDVKPTLLQLLGIKNLGTQDSVSLVAVFKSSKPLLSRHIFLESDFSPESIRTVYPETRKVLLEGVKLFQIDPLTTHLVIKPSMGQMIIHSKQYADIYGDWMLALYPQSNGTQMPILVNLVSGNWTNDLTSTFAKQSPAQSMIYALKAHFGQEIRYV